MAYNFPINYYSKLSDAQGGITNNDHQSNATVAGPSGVRWAYNNDINTDPVVIGASITGSLNGITSWRVIDNIGGDYGVKTNGDASLPNLNPGSTAYFAYPQAGPPPPPPCFLGNSQILCHINGADTYVAVENMKPGMLVKTSLNGYKKVEVIGKRDLVNPATEERLENRLYKCSPQSYPELTSDLIITGCHSILVDSLTEKQKEATIQKLGATFVTDRKYRLMACVDERAEPWTSAGAHTIWHFALENPDEKMNYGVYANGGLLVETCSINFMKNRSNMILI